MRTFFNWKQASLRLWAYGMVTIVGLWFVRSLIIGRGAFRWLKDFEVMAETLATSQGDVLWVLGICLVGGLTLMWVNQKSWLRRVLSIPFLILLGLTLLMGVVYWRFKAMTGHPITYPWLVYSDFLQSNEAKLVVLEQLDTKLILVIGLGLGIWFGAGFVLSKALVAWHRHMQTKRWVSWVLIGCLVGYFGWSSWHLQRHDYPINKRVSPIPHFVKTLPGFQSTPGIYTRSIPPSLQAEMLRWHTPLDTLSRPDTAIKNVLIFVLESTPENLLDLDDTLNTISPNLARFRRQGRYFPRAYSPIPSTNKALFSLLTGMYPSLSFSSITATSYDIPVTDISRQSWEAGARTGFFTSADNRFQHIDSFLAYRQFELIKDHRETSCEEGAFLSDNADWEHMDGMPDACMVPAASAWLDADSTYSFLAVCWTVQTHYPYFTTQPEQPFDTEDTYRNHYLNALHESDQAFGAMMDSLQVRGLDSSTLVIVLGDHGEAFGEHDQFGHASYIFEENVGIPLLLINPRLFGGDTDYRISSTIDIAPTISHIMGLRPAPSMQGQSLLGPVVRPHSYFLTPFSTILFGYGNNSQKSILDLGYGKMNQYDLRKDPGELSPLSGIDQGAALDTLSAWVQYHTKVMQEQGVSLGN